MLQQSESATQGRRRGGRGVLLDVAFGLIEVHLMRGTVYKYDDGGSERRAQRIM